MTIHVASLSASEPAAAQQSATAILDAGFEGIVLDAPLQYTAWRGLRELLPKDTVKAINLFLPYPRTLRPGERPSFSAAAENRLERAGSLAQARKTLEAVDELGIPLVLVPMTQLELAGLERGHLEPTSLLEQDQLGLRNDSEELRARYDSLLMLLSFLLEQAERYATTICLTPGNRPGELPLVPEIVSCLKEFGGAPLGLWLDTRRLPAELLGVPHIGAAASAPELDLSSRIQGAYIADETAEGAACQPGQGVVPWDQVSYSIDGLPLWCVSGEPAEGRRFLAGLEETDSPPVGLFEA
jgi:hypothetical protein